MQISKQIVGNQNQRHTDLKISTYHDQVGLSQEYKNGSKLGYLL